jgi:hypothetical protein
LRVTIGDVRTWAVGKAQAEATRLKALTDQGIDPRQVKADIAAAAETKAAAMGHPGDPRFDIHSACTATHKQKNT